MNFIYDLHRAMMTEHLVLVYQGEFSQETTKSLLAMAERSLEASREEPGVKRKVFNVMVEALQNIVKHGEERQDGQGAHPAIFLVGREAGAYSIMSGNPIQKTRVPGLKATLDRVNSLDGQGLKDLYKRIIQGTTLSDKGGAGLGFVDMARKSGEKLSFVFPEMSDSHCFFCLRVNIPLETSLKN